MQILSSFFKSMKNFLNYLMKKRNETLKNLNDLDGRKQIFSLKNF